MKISAEHKEFIRLVANVEQQLQIVRRIGIDKAIPKRGYYVYVVTENNIVCYIGKGKGGRVLSHFKKSSNLLLESNALI